MEKQVLTPKELAVLREIQSKTQKLVTELGEIALIKLQLENRSKVAKSSLEDINQMEQTFTQDILEQYGDSSLNPETGEITKVEQN